MKINVINYATNRAVGYGEARYYIERSLTTAGYQLVPYDEAEVKFWFCWPNNYRPDDPGYHIAYLPWESTALKEGWVDKLNQMDEVWTPSPLIGRWFLDAGVKGPIYIYNHGVDPSVWKPKYREASIVKYLIICGEAWRKGGKLLMDAFYSAFPSDQDVSLTLKMYGQEWNIPQIGRVRVVNSQLTLSELVRLYNDHSVFAYPSYGEGFSLPPLQAMSTGMPLICTEAWAPYAEYIDLPIRSTMIDSPWPAYHPGKVFEPDFDDLVDKLRYSRDSFDVLASQAYNKSAAVHARFDWDMLTLEAFKNLESRLQE